MKILCILNSLCFGGAENYTISLLNEFVKQGHLVKLIVLSNDLSLKNRLVSDVECIILPRKHKLDFFVLKKIRNEIKFGCFHAVICNYILYLKLACIFLKCKIPIIYPLHSTVALTKKNEVFWWFFFLLKKKNEIYLTSIDSQTEYIENHYSLRKDFFKQIYNGIDISKFKIVPLNFDKNNFLIKLGLNSSYKTILMVAGFRIEKRHKDAIMAFRQLKEHLYDVSFIMVGDNRIKKLNELKQLIKEFNINDIAILSAEEAGNILNYYWVADLFTLTSNKVETFPISSLEAMACGLPCVLTNIGGAKDFIKDGYNGFLVEPENIESIMNGWEKTLQNINHFDKENIRENIIKNFSIENSAQQYIELINNY